MQFGMARSSTVAALAALCGTACAAQVRRGPAALTHPPQVEAKSTSNGDTRPAGGKDAPSPVGLADEALRAHGVRLTAPTPTPAALLAALRAEQEVGPLASARGGDLVFFDLRDGQGCGGHVGVIVAVERDGRVRFREARDGRLLTSVYDPSHPTRRRDGHGRVLNTFLRPKRPGEPRNAPHFAGQMACAVARAATPAPSDRAVASLVPPPVDPNSPAPPATPAEETP